ncbi:bifunctional 3,4-dihydroxy-2-butanone-4-phosphate synthase/GTP cyclohydrolase II [Microlunatus sp. Gsoil 973]|uniref:bifunctional 3,4-dihydroxy-2-butanone-4-phosphate synthase/GTP cyclohydrolase II n=1 Tax=Microlunatus sp. Gsoil 973 TaxID=2672569 RepID=UPI0012B4EC7C|nr:bifunctional 3,4-dihydroxy-2-butanone-4-phosphate synthase/GTP cyclohydrolase II [Microlunatus sp. Gsoil 973]QGN34990.1 bifunctional 3,4-dihydroxy-2-butanone-4-phosphate synthase/GTP cyclohydrolase II [Microlunatus sp. Gsoil 973]
MTTGYRTDRPTSAGDTDNADDTVHADNTVHADDDLVAAAVREIAAGRPVVVTDDESRENEGDLIIAAELATPALMAFLIRYTSGVICAPMAGEDLDRLQVGPMIADNADPNRTAFTVTVDAADGVTTGISAADRSHTVHVLADPATTPDRLTRPGHIFPLRARSGGVLERRGHTEAGVDLARLAGLRSTAVISELINDDGTMMRRPQLKEFASRHGLIMISIDQLARYRWRHDSLLQRLTSTSLPTAHGTFTVYAYRSRVTGVEHLALVAGQPDGSDEPVLVRVHSECLTGDAFGSLRCDCGPQLQDALATISRRGRGVVVYLRGHEGRGIGLVNKLQAYRLQDLGRDTVDANLDLGLPADARSYDDAGQILRDLGIGTVRLITNNPAKVDGLRRSGIAVTERIATPAFTSAYNLGYLQTKHQRMGHDLLSGLTGERP